MILFKSVTFYFVGVVMVAVKSLDETTVNKPEEEVSRNETSHLDIAESIKSLQPNPQKKVNVKIYYESLCLYCRKFGDLLKINVMALHEYIDVQLYPYGNAETDESNGNYIVNCEDGEKQCYGNKLHACAIDLLDNNTQAVMYTSCMMNPLTEDDYGSNDATADVCALLLSMNSEPIKYCAKSSKGSWLLKFYGDETDKADIDGVPHILINGVESNYEDFSKDLIDAIKLGNSSPQLHTKNICLPTEMILTWFLHTYLAWL